MTVEEKKAFLASSPSNRRKLRSKTQSKYKAAPRSTTRKKEQAVVDRVNSYLRRSGNDKLLKSYQKQRRMSSSTSQFGSVDCETIFDVMQYDTWYDFALQVRRRRRRRRRRRSVDIPVIT
jgi:hypothetical protein